MQPFDYAFSRRTLLSTGAPLCASGLPSPAAEEKPAGGKLKVAIFSKHLQFLRGEALAAGAAEIGFDGIDLAVRKGGHVEPERVRQDLPSLVAAIRSHGLEVPMLTTDIVDADPRLAKLAALNSRYQAGAMYHTHSGIGLVGASIWDLYIVLKDFDPQAVGVNYDIGHATIEGGLGGWINSLRITGPHLRGVAVKDFLWEKDTRGWKANFKPLGTGLVPFP